MPYQSKVFTDCLNLIRQRICLGPKCSPIVLKEAELAKEFGVSRTPVRQILQFLAYSEMVETLPGIGTIATVLEPEDRMSHIEVYSNLALAAAACADGDQISNDTAVNFMSVSNWLSLTEHRTEADYVRLMARIIDTVGDIIEDPLLHRAYTSAHWRVLRWRIVDLREYPDQVWQNFEYNVERATQVARATDAGKLLRVAAGVGMHKVFPDNHQEPIDIAARR